MKSKKVTLERVVFLISFIFITASFIVTWFTHNDPFTLIPNSRIVVLVVHGICALCSLFLVFDSVFPLAIFVLLTESFLTMNVSYEQLGIVLFYSALFLMRLKGCLEKKLKLKMSILIAFHLISLICVLSHGISKFIIACCSSVFVMVIFLWIYDMVKKQLSCFIPVAGNTSDSIIKKKPGTELRLSEYKLTERQKKMLLDNIVNNLSYKDLSEKYFVSLSTVKKDFTEVFQIFGVSKLEELHLLLLRYQLVE